MDILEKIDYIMNEKLTFNIGDYIMQKGSDFESFGVVTKELKNGSYYAKVFVSHDGSTAGKAKQKSLAGWFPIPVKIDKKKIPSKILKKLT